MPPHVSFDTCNLDQVNSQLCSLLCDAAALHSVSCRQWCSMVVKGKVKPQQVPRVLPRGEG